jgi:hypothetical protein
VETTSVPPSGQSTRDIAAHQQVVDPGPGPLTRAVLGLLVGAATGALTVALTHREQPRTHGRPNLPADDPSR